MVHFNLSLARTNLMKPHLGHILRPNVNLFLISGPFNIFELFIHLFNSCILFVALNFDIYIYII